jgi:SAM-dependent methyltransferase
MGFAETQIQDFSYPKYDVRHLDVPDEAFDACVADQVIEHVETEPGSVIREAARIVRKGGIIVQATVMTYPVHFGPNDLWRFTPAGLRFLFEIAGLDVLQCGSWGGRLAVIFVVSGLANLSVPRWKHHPVKSLAANEGSNCPVVVWALGRKRDSL